MCTVVAVCFLLHIQVTQLSCMFHKYFLIQIPTIWTQMAQFSSDFETWGLLFSLSFGYSYQLRMNHVCFEWRSQQFSLSSHTERRWNPLFCFNAMSYFVLFLFNLLNMFVYMQRATTYFQSQWHISEQQCVYLLCSRLHLNKNGSYLFSSIGNFSPFKGIVHRI